MELVLEAFSKNRILHNFSQLFDEFEYTKEERSNFLSFLMKFFYSSSISLLKQVVSNHDNLDWQMDELLHKESNLQEILPSIYIEKLMSFIKRSKKSNPLAYKTLLSNSKNGTYNDFVEHMKTFMNDNKEFNYLFKSLNQLFLMRFSLAIQNYFIKDLVEIEREQDPVMMKAKADELLKKAIEKMEASENKIKKALLEENKIFENDQLVVYKCTSYKFATIIGKGTKWCIAATNDPEKAKNDYEYYSSLGDMYVFVFKNLFDSKKRQKKLLLTINNRNFEERLDIIKKQCLIVNNFYEAFFGNKPEKLKVHFTFESFLPSEDIKFINNNFDDIKKIINIIVSDEHTPELKKFFENMFFEILLKKCEEEKKKDFFYILRKIIFLDNSNIENDAKELNYQLLNFVYHVLFETEIEYFDPGTVSNVFTPYVVDYFKSKGFSDDFLNKFLEIDKKLYTNIISNSLRKIDQDDLKFEIVDKNFKFSFREFLIIIRGYQEERDNDYFLALPNDDHVYFPFAPQVGESDEKQREPIPINLYRILKTWPEFEEKVEKYIKAYRSYENPLAFEKVKKYNEEETDKIMILKDILNRSSNLSFNKDFELLSLYVKNKDTFSLYELGNRLGVAASRHTMYEEKYKGFDEFAVILILKNNSYLKAKYKNEPFEIEERFKNYIEKWVDDFVFMLKDLVPINLKEAVKFMKGDTTNAQSNLFYYIFDLIITKIRGE